MIEDALRKSFAARVATPPAVDDPAGRAVRRGRAMRRRRAVGSGAAVLVLFAGVLGGAATARHAWLTGQNGQNAMRGAPAAAPSAPDAAPRSVVETPATPPSSPAAASPPAEVGVEPDVRVGNEVWTAAGERIELTGSAPVSAVYRVPAGWVYAAGELRLMRPGQGWVGLAERPDGWAVSGDGSRLAYATGNSMTIGNLTAQGLDVRVTVPVEPGVTPVAFAGDHLVITRDGGFDFMSASGAYTPTWTRSVVAVYGARSTMAAGLVRSGGGYCLAELAFKPAGLVVHRTGGCKLKLAAALGARLSPDGGRLAVPDGDAVSVVDLERAFAAGKSAAKAAKAVVSCPGLVGTPPVWLAGGTLATADRDGPRRCRRDGTDEAAELPGEARTGWAYVPAFAGSA